MNFYYFLPLFLLTVQADWPCPCGQYNIRGACRYPICNDSKFLPPCVTECPPGKWPMQHLCGPIPRCPNTTAALKGRCVPTCKPDELPTEDQCVICEPPSILVEGHCMPCPYFTRPVNNMCIMDCPSGYELIDDECQPTCDYWMHAVNGQCVNYCQAGYKAYRSENGEVQCFAHCPANTYAFEQLCVDVCPAGFEGTTLGVCVEYYFGWQPMFVVKPESLVKKNVN